MRKLYRPVCTHNSNSQTSLHRPYVNWHDYKLVHFAIQKNRIDIADRIFDLAYKLPTFVQKGEREHLLPAMKHCSGIRKVMEAVGSFYSNLPEATQIDLELNNPSLKTVLGSLYTDIALSDQTKLYETMLRFEDIPLFASILELISSNVPRIAVISDIKAYGLEDRHVYRTCMGSSILVDFGKIAGQQSNAVNWVIRVLFHEFTHNAVHNMFGWFTPYKEDLYTKIFGGFAGIDTQDRNQLRYDKVVTQTLLNIHNFFDQVDQKKRFYFEWGS